MDHLTVEAASVVESFQTQAAHATAHLRSMMQRTMQDTLLDVSRCVKSATEKAEVANSTFAAAVPPEAALSVQAAVKRLFDLRLPPRLCFVRNSFVKGGGGLGGSHKGAAYSKLMFPQPNFGSRFSLGG